MQFVMERWQSHKSVNDANRFLIFSTDTMMITVNLYASSGCALDAMQAKSQSHSNASAVRETKEGGRLCKGSPVLDQIAEEATPDTASEHDQIAAEAALEIETNWKTATLSSTKAIIKIAIEKADIEGYWRGRGDAERFRAEPSATAGEQDDTKWLEVFKRCWPKVHKAIRSDIMVAEAAEEISDLADLYAAMRVDAQDDTKRLDWLSNMYSLPNKGKGWKDRELREAIDAAMRKEAK